MTRSALGLDRWDHATGGLLGLSGLVLYIWRLNVPAQYVYDEIYHAYTAAQFALGNKEAYEWWTTPPAPAVSFEWTHPPLAKLLMAAGIRIFGDNSFGWRIASVIVGSIALVIFYHLAKALLQSRPWAIVATLLLALDGLFMVESRTAMNDIFVATGLLAAYLFYVGYLRVPALGHAATLYILGASFCLGLGFGSKWVAVYSLGGFGLVTAYRGLAQMFPALSRRTLPATVTDADMSTSPEQLSTAGSSSTDAAGEPVPPGRPAPTMRSRMLRLVVQLAALSLIPAALYVASYGQFFTMGHDLSQFVELQRQMWWYHTNLTAGHDYGSRWWTWPLLIRPVWFYVDRGEGTIANIYNLGNPLIWWAILPALVYLIYRYVRRPSLAPGIILMGYLIQWLPWELSPRVSFFYHMLPSLPFGVLALGSGLQRLWPRGTWAKRFAVVYLALVVASFVYFYPIWTGWPLSDDFAAQHFWVPTWR